MQPIALLSLNVAASTEPIKTELFLWSCRTNWKLTEFSSIWV